MSSRLNQDESNYKFRIKLLNKPEPIDGYFRDLMSLYGTSTGFTPSYPQLTYRTHPQPVHSKPSLQPSFHRSETKDTNFNMRPSFRNKV